MAADWPVRLILASASPARLAALTSVGFRPEVRVSDVDESVIEDPDPANLTLRLARAKAEAVASTVASGGDQLIVGCDSLLELDGQAQGKPASAAEAVQRWHQMRGRSGFLHTGHHVIRKTTTGDREASAVATTEVHFADVSDDEIAAYVATGEPLRVAGAFTIDGLGGGFITKINGDPHTVVGISLPLLRQLFAGLGVSWVSLWADSAPH